MKFMVIVKASKASEAGQMPSEQLLAAMGKYNEDLAKAGTSARSSHRSCAGRTSVPAPWPGRP